MVWWKKKEIIKTNSHAVPQWNLHRWEPTANAAVARCLPPGSPPRWHRLVVATTGREMPNIAIQPAIKYCKWRGIFSTFLKIFLYHENMRHFILTFFILFRILRGWKSKMMWTGISFWVKKTLLDTLNRAIDLPVCRACPSARVPSDCEGCFAGEDLHFAHGPRRLRINFLQWKNWGDVDRR